MKIVVTGATGFVGVPLVRELQAAGHVVTAVTRDVGRAVSRLPAACRVLAWEPAAPDPELFRGADAIVHLAGEGIADKRWSAARKRAIADSRTAGTRALVATLARLAKGSRPKTLIAASAIGWYGNRGDLPLDERSTPGVGFLADVCREWEQETFRAAELEIRTAAVRIGVVLGRGGGALAKMLPLFRLGVGGRVGSGQQWFSWIHLHDLVSLFRYLVENDRASGPVNGVAPETVTNAVFTHELGRALNRPAILPVPAIALRLAFGEMSTVLLASQRVRPTAAERLGFTFRYPTLADACHNLCADPTHELVTEQRLSLPPERVFPFFADPENLEKITPEFLRFRVLGATTPRLRDGTLIDYRLRLHGIPVRWQSRIESWRPSRTFVDLQTRGPYRLWHHTHEFEAVEGGTVMRDRVRYQLPFGALGDLAASWMVKRDLERIFDYRRMRIAELLP